MVKTRSGEIIGTHVEFREKRVYTFRDLRVIGVPYSRKHVTQLEKLAQFPMHFQLGPNSVAWVAAEVDLWLEDRIRRRPQPKPATAEARPELDRSLAEA